MNEDEFTKVEPLFFKSKELFEEKSYKTEYKSKSKTRVRAAEPILSINLDFS
jgi:hypothetical protein